MYLEVLDRKVLEGQEAELDLQELKENQDRLVFLDEMARLVYRDCKDHRASVDQLDQLGSKAQGVYLDQLGPQGLWDHQGYQESPFKVQQSLFHQCHNRKRQFLMHC